MFSSSICGGAIRSTQRQRNNDSALLTANTRSVCVKCFRHARRNFLRNKRNVTLLPFSSVTSKPSHCRAKRRYLSSSESQQHPVGFAREMRWSTRNPTIGKVRLLIFISQAKPLDDYRATSTVYINIHKTGASHWKGFLKSCQKWPSHVLLQNLMRKNIYAGCINSS